MYAKIEYVISVRTYPSKNRIRTLRILEPWPSHSSFMSIKHLREIPTASSPAGALNTDEVGYKNFAISDQ